MATPEQRRDAWDAFAAGYDEAVTPFSMRISAPGETPPS
jgi:hypothetical protein